ncbi:hypothetical protein IOCL1545_000707900, partial [Leishmania shawi]
EVSSVNHLSPAAKGVQVGAEASSAGELPYETLNTVTVIQLVERTPDVCLLLHSKVHSAEAVSDGNLNPAFPQLSEEDVYRAVEQ